MAGEDYGNTGASLLDQHVTHDIDRYGVKARKRFVQNEYRWVVNQRRRELHTLLSEPLAGLFGAVHILPFFDSIDGADAGFDPIDHTRVDPKLGSWADIKALAQDMDVMADVIVNHMSSESPQFIDYSRRGAAAPCNGLFLTFDAVFPNGATERDLLAVYRPRPGLPCPAAARPVLVHSDRSPRRHQWKKIVSPARCSQSDRRE